MTDAVAAPAVQKSTSKPVLMPDKIGLAEHKRNDWVVDIDPRLTIDEILEPAFWAHTAAALNPLDKIEARWEDGSRIVHMRVRFCERNYAKVKVVSVEELGSVISDIPEPSKKHRVEWKGPMMRFAVIRLSDSEVVSKGHKTREEAAKWVVDHEAT